MTRLRMLLAHPTQQLETVPTRQPKVQNHQVESRCYERRLCRCCVLCPRDLEAILPQAGADAITYQSVVFHH